MPPTPTLLSRAALRRIVTFPDPRDADTHGLVAFGGTFEPAVLLAAYTQGIFPWPSEELPYAWFCPDPRLILPLDAVHVSRSLQKTIRRGRFTVTFDTAFEQVIEACSEADRDGQAGTWITDELIEGFLELHHEGFAHSVETWQDGQLAGGLYGLAVGAAFCGESMFFHQPDASKVAFVHLLERLQSYGFHFVDCQVHTEHLTRFGAHEIPRDKFLHRLDRALDAPTWRGSWTEEG